MPPPITDEHRKVARAAFSHWSDDPGHSRQRQAGAAVIRDYAEKVGNHEWKRGFVCAAAVILRTHGCEVVAKDVLRCAGSDALEHADAEDIATLKQHGLAS